MNIAKILTEDGRQAVLLPDEVRIEGTEVLVKQIGKSLLLTPRITKSWDLLRASLAEFTDDYMLDRSQPTNQIRQWLDE